ncbi:hypothetical protein IF1G_09434 [Cordyceps javanica]|uniref:Uncharacterized protein n=1 Tax=Cordyceps javanica TaxID=43265 RepID=A0A545UQV7_9HYPO|nr:hypothetical protein IF1G_09434 [Cordyceps javanica]
MSLFVAGPRRRARTQTATFCQLALTHTRPAGSCACTVWLAPFTGTNGLIHPLLAPRPSGQAHAHQHRNHRPPKLTMTSNLFLVPPCPISHRSSTAPSLHLSSPLTSAVFLSFFFSPLSRFASLLHSAQHPAASASLPAPQNPWPGPRQTPLGHLSCGVFPPYLLARPRHLGTFTLPWPLPQLP